MSAPEGQDLTTPGLPKIRMERNPIVFFDFQVGPERVGRMVIELRKDVVPKTAENFRKLCVGDQLSESSNRKLSYTATRIHKVQRLFAVCGGTIGKIGESIYGPTFPDENFDLLHTTGAVSMANFGPNTNNSQFFITSGDCSHLDGTNVVCGYVVRGLGIISEMERVATDDGTPTADILIVNSGELQPDGSWELNDPDDNLPPFPIDWEQYQAFQLMNDPDKVLALLETIKRLGNGYYSQRDFVNALRKYKKVVRYSDAAAGGCLSESVAKLRLENLLNMAACHLKLGGYREVITACTDVIRVGRDYPDQCKAWSKAFYRRGVAAIEMKEYESALEDLKQAHSLSPKDPNILDQFNRGKAMLIKYRQTEKTLSQKMCKDLNL